MLSQLPKNIIPRDSYIDRIRPFIRKNIAKVLIGQRRVGKSYLLYQLVNIVRAEDEKANIIFINMEDFAFSHIRTAENLYNHISSLLQDNAINYIFIDEIQEVAEFERVVRSLLLADNNDVYITGSNANMLSSELATHLSARYVEFDVFSLSYSEFLAFHHLVDSDESLSLYERYGGLPYLANLPMREDVVGEYIKSVYSTILYRDVVTRYKLRNTVFLERLAIFLSENIGSIFSAKKISDYLKSQQTPVSVPQIQSYTGYLCSSFIIHRVDRYDLVGKRIFEIGEKFYFENLGIRNALIGYRVQDKAKLMENMVYNQLLFKGYNVKVGYLGGMEIDFVAEKNGERTYIQVALRIDSKETAVREFGNLLKIADNYRKIVVTADNFEGNSYEGIQHFHIRRFLTDFQ